MCFSVDTNTETKVYSSTSNKRSSSESEDDKMRCFVGSASSLELFRLFLRGGGGGARGPRVRDRPRLALDASGLLPFDDEGIPQRRIGGG